MPLIEHCLRIPKGLHDEPLTLGTDCIYITATEECCWTYTDKGGCFPPSGANGSLPLPGTVAKGDYGPCTPIKPGKVAINAVSGTCKDKKIHAVAHTISVGPGG
jgi:hypothetical protein